METTSQASKVITLVVTCLGFFMVLPTIQVSLPGRLPFSPALLLERREQA